MFILEMTMISEVGGQLSGYRLSSAMPQDQQWGVVSVDNVSLVSSHVTGALSRSSVQVGSSFSSSLSVYFFFFFFLTIGSYSLPLV